MAHKTTASDRKSLVRLAASLPKGSPGRKLILRMASGATPAEMADRNNKCQQSAFTLGVCFAGYPHIADNVSKTMKQNFPQLSKKIMGGYEEGQKKLDMYYDYD